MLHFWIGYVNLSGPMFGQVSHGPGTDFIDLSQYNTLWISISQLKLQKQILGKFWGPDRHKLLGEKCLKMTIYGTQF